MRDRFLFLLLGAALVLAGYFLGQVHTPNAAEAQSFVLGNDVHFFRYGDAIVSSSNDGKTLHFWATNDRVKELDRKPVYIASVSADAARP